MSARATIFSASKLLLERHGDASTLSSLFQPLTTHIFNYAYIFIYCAHINCICTVHISNIQFIFSNIKWYCAQEFVSLQTMYSFNFLIKIDHPLRDDLIIGMYTSTNTKCRRPPTPPANHSRNSHITLAAHKPPKSANISLALCRKFRFLVCKVCGNRTKMQLAKYRRAVNITKNENFH